MAPPAHPDAVSGIWLLASLNAGFVVVFGLFAVAFLVLCVVTLRWAIRRDRAGREQWLRRRQAQMAAPLDDGRRLRDTLGSERSPDSGNGSNGHSPGGPAS